jgi:hypothetical protein
MWQGLVEWGRSQMIRPGFELAAPDDFDIPICVNSTDDALTIIRHQHREWRQKREAAATDEHAGDQLEVRPG